MGRATRWFKELFFRPPPPPPQTQQNHTTTTSVAAAAAADDWYYHNPNISPAQAAWLSSFYSEPDTQQGMHARAVAAATAAAADAAVAAAQAAFEVVRLTSHGQVRENWAAVNIQRVFRGFLARKAHRALKGLVRIQALVRGFLVRKQAAATLHGMEALARTQAALRSKKITHQNFKFPGGLQFQPTTKSSSSSSSLDKPAVEQKATFESHSKKLSAAAASLEEVPKIVEVDTWCRPKSKSSKKIINKWIIDSNSLMVDDHHHHHNRHHHPQLECSSFSSAQSTPRATWRAEAGFLGWPRPNYMVNTQSFRAKLRSQSAPKQRITRRASLGEVMGARISLSGEIRTKGHHHHPQEALDFKKAVMVKLGIN